MIDLIAVLQSVPPINGMEDDGDEDEERGKSGESEIEHVKRLMKGEMNEI